MRNRVRPGTLVIPLLTLMLQGLGAPTSAGSTRADLGWDLSYKSILHANRVDKGDWLAKWTRSHEGGPIHELIKNWNHEPIVSSILLDVPAFHAGERVVHFLARTSKATYVWVFMNGKPEEAQDKTVDSALYDKLLAEVRSWSQAPPLPQEKAAEEIPPGYFGFLSLYESGRSRQMLLTVEDFYVPGAKGWDHPDDGRVLVAFGPLGETYD